jgi:hypothetical protein
LHPPDYRNTHNPQNAHQGEIKIMGRFFISHQPAGRLTIALMSVLLTAGCVTTSGVDHSKTGTAPKSSTDSGDNSQTPAQTASPESLTPSERRMREQSNAFQKTVWQGALIGAGTTGLIAVLVGEETAMLASLFGGGAAGGLSGSYVAHKQKQFSNKEDVLNSMIADVRKSNAETQEFIVSVREVIAEDQRRLAAVEQQVRKGQATQAELDNTRRRIADNKRIITQASQGARERQVMFQGAETIFHRNHPDSDTGGLQRELDAFNINIKTLESLAQSVSTA